MLDLIALFMKIRSFQVINQHDDNKKILKGFTSVCLSVSSSASDRPPQPPRRGGPRTSRGLIGSVIFLKTSGPVAALAANMSF